MTIDELIIWLGDRFRSLVNTAEATGDQPWAVNYVCKGKVFETPGFKTPIEAFEYAISDLIENDPEFEKGKG